MTKGHRFPRCIKCGKEIMCDPGKPLKWLCPVHGPRLHGIDPNKDPFEVEAGEEGGTE